MVQVNFHDQTRPPRMLHQMPLLLSRTQRKHKDSSSDVPSNAVLMWHQMQAFRMQLLCLQLEASCLQWIFNLQLTIVFTYTWGFSLTILAFLLTVAFCLQFYLQTKLQLLFAYSGQVRLISALRDCKQRSSTVSKKTPTASKKSFPLIFFWKF